MKLIVGLGNPGIKYKKTRHNLGFLVVDQIQKKFDQFSKWQLNKKLKAKISQAGDTVLAKPQTYMNDSGLAVKSLIGNWKLEIENLYVIHDDLDLPLGKFKLQKGRGSAGHKGVQSIIDEVNSKDFWRLRIGIKPQRIENREQRTEKFVLGRFSKKEEKIIQKIIKKAIQTIITLQYPTYECQGQIPKYREHP